MVLELKLQDCISFSAIKLGCHKSYMYRFATICQVKINSHPRSAHLMLKRPLKILQLMTTLLIHCLKHLCLSVSYHFIQQKMCTYYKPLGTISCPQWKNFMFPFSSHPLFSPAHKIKKLKNCYKIYCKVSVLS